MNKPTELILKSLRKQYDLADDATPAEISSAMNEAGNEAPTPETDVESDDVDGNEGTDTVDSTDVESADVDTDPVDADQTGRIAEIERTITALKAENANLVKQIKAAIAEKTSDDPDPDAATELIEPKSYHNNPLNEGIDWNAQTNGRS